MAIEIAIFGAGCFWEIEEVFRQIDGVIDTQVGYMGGDIKNPTYEQVCSNKTGHVEVVKINFKPSIITYNRLVDIFFSSHDPTQINKQGMDVGSQYRSVIFYNSKAQKIIAENSIRNINYLKKSNKIISTTVESTSKFYLAEEFHQKYLMKRGERSCHL